MIEADFKLSIKKNFRRLLFRKMHFNVFEFVELIRSDQTKIEVQEKVSGVYTK